MAPTTEAAFEYVTIPKEDIYGRDWQKMMINREEFFPGQTYKVSPEIAGELRRMIARKEIADRRVLDPRQDRGAVTTVERNTLNQAFPQSFPS